MDTRAGYRRFLIGGIGGLAPVVALAVAADITLNLDNAGLHKIVGYSLRVLALFLIGGFVAWLHEEESKNFKLFEIGLGAPALIAGLLTTNSLIGHSEEHASTGNLAEAVAGWVIPSASAQDAAPNAPAASSKPASRGSPTFAAVKHLQSPPPTALFWEGFIGLTPPNAWYVTAGTFPRQDQAEQRATLINAMNKDLKAEVYVSPADSKEFSVVLGSQLERRQARSLRKKALAAGVVGEVTATALSN